MQKNFDNFSMQDVMQLVNSPTGQQLLALLQKTDSEALSKAKAQASTGDYSQLSKTLAPLLASEDVQKLLRQLGG